MQSNCARFFHSISGVCVCFVVHGCVLMGKHCIRMTTDRPTRQTTGRRESETKCQSECGAHKLLGRIQVLCGINWIQVFLVNDQIILYHVCPMSYRANMPLIGRCEARCIHTWLVTNNEPFMVYKICWTYRTPCSKCRFELVAYYIYGIYTSTTVEKAFWRIIRL